MQRHSARFNLNLFPTSLFASTRIRVAGMVLLALISQSAAAARFLSLPSTYASGGVPQQLAAADVNHDGIPDLIVSNANGVVSLLVGKAGGGFAAAKTIATFTGGTPPIAVGDFNGDSYPDLAVSVKSANSVWVYLNHGDGTFGAPGKYATGSMPGQLAVGDINPDSRLDIVVVTATGLSALQGNGNGTFKAAVNTTGVTGGTLIALGDLNRDGHLDAIVSGNSPEVEFIGSGNGHFVKSSNVVPHSGQIPSQIALADVDHDGLLDFVMATVGDRSIFISYVSIAWGKGDGTFTAPQTFSGHNSPALVVADFNGDGRPDLGIADGYANSVSVILDKSGRTFAAPSSYKVGEISLFSSITLPGAIAAADFTGDHHTDIVVATKNGVQIVKNTGNGSMAAPLAADAILYPTVVFAAPFNKDSNIDLALQTMTDRNVPLALVLFGDGTGRFPKQFDPFVEPKGLSIGKFDKDALLDMAYIDVSDQSIISLFNLGNNTFSVSSPILENVGGDSMTVGDFNGDGISDFAVLDGTSVDIYVSHGVAIYSGPTSYGAGAGPVSMLVWDINNDGKRDLLIADNQGKQIVVLLGNGNGTFQSPRFSPTVLHPSVMTVGDFNHDGKLDIAAGCEKSVEVKLGNGNGTFAAAKSYAAANAVLSLSQASLRRNATLDLLFTDGSSLRVMMGKGDGTFNTPVAYGVGINPAGIAVSDFNNDGSVDAAVVDQKSTALTILLNLGGTRITLHSSGTTVKKGVPVTFTATVAATVAGAGVPTGTLAFRDGSKSIATVQLSNGKASFTTSQLSAGTHSMTASYWETAAFNPGVSAPVTETITP